jgi:hypothetical protein
MAEYYPDARPALLFPLCYDSRMTRRTAAIVYLVCGVVSAGAIQLTLDRRAIEEAIYIGQSRIESERTRFHVPYRVRVAQPPIDWIDVITPFHRVELAAEMNARSGRRQFGQRDALETLGSAPDQIDLLIEMTFHPLNTFVAVPSYQVELILPGGRRLALRRIDRFPRFGPRPESQGPALPTPDASPVFGGGLPVLGGTMVAVLDGSMVDPKQRVDVVVMDGKTELARTAVDLGKMR